MRSNDFWQYYESVSPQLGARASTFAKAFEYLDRFSRPVGIVATGCLSASGDVAQDGGSTLLFDKYTEFHPGSVVYAVDIDADAHAVERLSKLVSARVHMKQGNSVALLKRLADSPPANLASVDLVYFHARETNQDAASSRARHQIKELLAVSPLVHAETLLVIDDSPASFSGHASAAGSLQVIARRKDGGMGKLAAEYFEQIGAEMVFEGYQCGWIRMRGGVRAAVPPSAFLAAIVTASPQGKFAVGIEDEFIGRSLRQTGTNGLHEIERAATRFGRDDEVLVVGTHVGTIAIPLAARCRHITLIEANPWTFKLLQCNLILNEVRNATALHMAASDKKEMLKFVMNTHNSGGSKRLPRVREHMYFYDNPMVVEVPAEPLDDRFADREFALIFMDIEGSEYFALQGMQKILGKAGTLIVEFLPHLLTNVAAASPEQLVALIAPHFNKLFIPTRNQSVGREEFGPVLRAMFDADEADQGIVFSK
jgi:FkbM family methyltransferase